MRVASVLAAPLRRRLLLATVLAGLGVGAPALASAASETASGASTAAAGAATETPRAGGTLTLLVHPEPPTLTTIAHSAGSAVTLSGKVTEGLLTYDFDLTPRPQLATAWAVSDDGLTYTFRLREGVRWHDGEPFTSADAAHSIALLKEHHPRGRATFSSVAAIETPDANTLVLRLSQPVPYLIKAFAASESPIVPRHLYLEGAAPANPNNNQPVGTGPFRFKEWVRGSHVIYERNPDYWDAPKPYVDQLVVRFIPDAGARSAALESGEVLLAPGSPVPLADIDRLRQIERLHFETRGYEYINSISRLEFNLENPVLADLRVRQAIAHALDRQALLRTVWYGHGELIAGPVAPALAEYLPDLPVLPYDLEAARQLLVDAGYPQGRGPEGRALRLKVVPIANEGGIRTANYLKQALGRLGIEVDIFQHDFASYIPRIYTERDFDIHVSVMSNTFDPTVGIQRLYWSKNFRRGLPFSNGSGYASAEVDRLLEAAAVETDPQQRRAAFDAFQRQIVHDLPDITLLAIETQTVADRRVRDHTVGADGVAGNLAGVWLAAP